MTRNDTNITKKNIKNIEDCEKQKNQMYQDVKSIFKSYNAFISTSETSNGTSAGWVIATDTAGDLYVHSGAALAGNYSGDITLPLNQWSHVAYTRASGTHRLFLNGVAAANSTSVLQVRSVL